ncbi:MAG: hypothetical protein ACHP7O_01210 [Burkholderiales bacterium]
MAKNFILNVLGFKNIEYPDKKTGKPSFFKQAQCTLVTEELVDGVRVENIAVCRMGVPRHMPDMVVGKYIPEFGPMVNFDCDLVGSLVSLTPWVESAVVKPASMQKVA